MSDDDEINSIVTDIALVKKDIKQIEEVFVKFDKVAGQMSEILKNLAVQEAMLKNNEKRVEILEKKFVQHNKDEMEFHRDLNKRLDELKEASEKHREDRHKELMSAMSDMKTSFDNKLDEQNQRITKLENWKWYVMGIAALIVFFATVFPWNVIFTG